MGTMLSARVAGAVGLLSLALLTAGLISLPIPTTGAALPATSPALSVNRTLKGDRLPISRPTVWPDEHGADAPGAPVHARSRAQIPFGCDRAFSPISSPLLAHVFRRCMV